MLSSLIGVMILNHHNKDPEWRFQAGCLADFLESGGPMPQGKSLGAIWRISGSRMLTREEIIQWARSQEVTLN